MLDAMRAFSLGSGPVAQVVVTITLQMQCWRIGEENDEPILREMRRWGQPRSAGCSGGVFLDSAVKTNRCA